MAAWSSQRSLGATWQCCTMRWLPAASLMRSRQNTMSSFGFRFVQRVPSSHIFDGKPESTATVVSLFRKIDSAYVVGPMHSERLVKSQGHRVMKDAKPSPVQVPPG